MSTSTGAAGDADQVDRGADILAGVGHLVGGGGSGIEQGYIQAAATRYPAIPDGRP